MFYEQFHPSPKEPPKTQPTTQKSVGRKTAASSIIRLVKTNLMKAPRPIVVSGATTPHHQQNDRMASRKTTRGFIIKLKRKLLVDVGLPTIKLGRGAVRFVVVV